MAMRRQIRLRKEYLYKKSLEGRQREEYEKKEAIRKALNGKDIYCAVFPFLSLLRCPKSCFDADTLVMQMESQFRRSSESLKLRCVVKWILKTMLLDSNG